MVDAGVWGVSDTTQRLNTTSWVYSMFRGQPYCLAGGEALPLGEGDSWYNAIGAARESRHLTDSLDSGADKAVIHPSLSDVTYGLSKGNYPQLTPLLGGVPQGVDGITLTNPAPLQDVLVATLLTLPYLDSPEAELA